MKYEPVAVLGEPRPVFSKEVHVKKRKYPGRKPGSETVSKEEREGIVADYKSGMLVPDLAAKYKRSKSTIWGTARRAGLSSRRSVGKKHEEAKVEKPKKIYKHVKFLTDNERARIVADYQGGMLQSAIVAKYKRSKEAVLRSIQLAGVQLRGRGNMGGKSGTTKSVREKMRKKANKAAVNDSIRHANKALAHTHMNGDVVGRAVSALMKSLEHEEIQEILIDFNSRQYRTTRLRVEEGRAV